MIDYCLSKELRTGLTVYTLTFAEVGFFALDVYYNQTYGELFDLESDPGEVDNLWDRPDCAELKAELVMKLLHAEMGKEPLWMPRVWGA